MENRAIPQEEGLGSVIKTVRELIAQTDSRIKASQYQ